ncbi:MAG: hypothetical protein ACREGL_07555 [Alphaproteobacteria bacterium]
MAAPRVKTSSAAAAKWARRASSASGEYQTGVEAATGWQAAAVAAQPNYETGVTAAIGRKAYGKGVNRVGDAGWKKATIDKGPMRFSQGVGVGEPAYATGVAPYLEAIGRTDLPPRGAVGSDGNYQRVVAIGKALRALKVGR